MYCPTQCTCTYVYMYMTTLIPHIRNNVIKEHYTPTQYCYMYTYTNTCTCINETVLNYLLYVHVSTCTCICKYNCTIH